MLVFAKSNWKSVDDLGPRVGRNPGGPGKDGSWVKETDWEIDFRTCYMPRFSLPLIPGNGKNHKLAIY